jgi:hypothetical protein
LKRIGTVCDASIDERGDFHFWLIQVIVFKDSFWQENFRQIVVWNRIIYPQIGICTRSLSIESYVVIDKLTKKHGERIRDFGFTSGCLLGCFLLIQSRFPGRSMMDLITHFPHAWFFMRK